MKKFEFPLERIRQFRKLQMETEQARLEQCNARLMAVDAMIGESKRQRLDADADVRRVESSGGEVSIAAVRSHSAFRGYLTRVDQMLAARRTQAEADLETQRGALLEARKRYEILDRFKDQSRKGWQAEFDREQEALAGELFLAKWNHRNPGGERRVAGD